MEGGDDAAGGRQLRSMYSASSLKQNTQAYSRDGRVRLPPSRRGRRTWAAGGACARGGRHRAALGSPARGSTQPCCACGWRAFSAWPLCAPKPAPGGARARRLRPPNPGAHVGGACARHLAPHVSRPSHASPVAPGAVRRRADWCVPSRALGQPVGTARGVAPPRGSHAPRRCDRRRARRGDRHARGQRGHHGERPHAPQLQQLIGAQRCARCTRRRLARPRRALTKPLSPRPPSSSSARARSGRRSIAPSRTCRRRRSSRRTR